MTAPAGAAAIVLPPGRRALVIVPVLLSTTLFVMNQTNVVVALPHMQGTFSATRDQIAWVLTAYIVAMTITTATAGWFSARFGRKTVFLWSIVGFGVASVLCANAPSLETEVAFRLLQGLAGGPIMPLTQAIMLDVYPRERHGSALGLWGVGITIGPVLGPIVGGVLTEDYGWPWVFYFNIPFSIVVFVGVMLFVPATPRDQGRKLDWLGFGALAAAIVGLQYVLNRGQRLDWYDSTEIVIATAATALALYVLVVHTATARSSFLDPSMFLDRNFVLGLAFIFVWAMTVQSPLVILSLRLQSVDEIPVSAVGFLMAPRGLGGIIAMLLVGRMVAYFDPKLVTAIGFACVAASAWLMQGWAAIADLEEVGLAGFVMGIGTALAYVALTVIAMSTLAGRLRPEAVSLYSLVLNMGSGVGIAISVIVLSQGVQIHHETLAANVTKFNDLFRDHLLPDIWDFGTRSGLTAVDKEVLNQATAMAFNDTFRLMMVGALGVIPLILLLARRPKSKGKR